MAEKKLIVMSSNFLIKYKKIPLTHVTHRHYYGFTYWITSKMIWHTILKYVREWSFEKKESKTFVADVFKTYLDIAVWLQPLSSTISVALPHPGLFGYKSG